MEIQRDIAVKKLLSAPESVQNALGSNKYILVIRTISTKHALNDSQTSALSRAAMFLVVDLVTKEDLPIKLEKELGIVKEKAELIAKDVLEHVLGHIAELGSAPDLTDEELEKSMLKPTESAKNENLSFLDEKLENIVKNAPDKIKEKTFETQPAAVPPQKNTPQKPQIDPSTPLPKQYPGGSDPYREPIE